MINLQSVDELLTLAEQQVEEKEYCTVDDNTRVVTVPEIYKMLGVESDKRAKRIWFKFPKLVGNNGVDLSSIGVRVNFRNANGDGDIYIVEDLTTDGDYVIFSWELTRKVTAYKGNVSFVVCAVKSATDGTTKNEWNTTLNKECEVLEGLEVTEQIKNENPDIIEYILANLGGSVSAEDIENAVADWMTEHPPSGMTAEEKAQLNKNTDDISSLSDEIANLTGTGLSTEAIDKLEEVGNYLVYTTANGGSKWTELIAILRNGSSGGGSSETVPATGISLDKITLSFTTATTQTLTATVEPSNSTDKVTWESSNTGVATVSGGVITPVSNGSCTITAKAGSYSASCEVTVAVETASEEVVLLKSITGDGASYIDTEFIVEDNTNVFELSATLADADSVVLFGADGYNVGTPYGSTLLKNINSGFIYGTLNQNQFRNVGTWNNSGVNSLVGNQFFAVIQNGSQKIYLDEAHTKQQENATNGTVEYGTSLEFVPISLYLFTSNVTAEVVTTYTPCDCTIYFFKITDSSGSVVHEFVPAKQGSKIGMYDTVTQKFHENKGTGTFAYEEFEVE